MSRREAFVCDKADVAVSDDWKKFVWVFCMWTRGVRLLPSRRESRLKRTVWLGEICLPDSNHWLVVVWWNFGRAAE